MIGSDVMDLALMGGPYWRLMFMIGLGACIFLLHFVYFRLHGCYLALGFGQLVCSLQHVLLRGQLLGEDVFLLFQGLKLEAYNCELVLVGPRRSCDFVCGAWRLGFRRWELCGRVFLGGSRIILVFLRGGSVSFLLCGAIEGWLSSWKHGGRPCWVLGFFTTQSICIHEG